LCPWKPNRDHPFDPDCQCALIARVYADLRAKVEALPSWEVLGSELLLRSDVLALLDEAQR
jgi:hypothetical protein